MMSAATDTAMRLERNIACKLALYQFAFVQVTRCFWWDRNFACLRRTGRMSIPTARCPSHQVLLGFGHNSWQQL